MRIPKNIADAILANPEAKIGPSVRMPDETKEFIKQVEKAIKSAGDLVRVKKQKDMADVLKEQCHLAGLPVPERDVRLVDKRRWKWDCHWPRTLIGRFPGLFEVGLVVEVHGGIAMRKGHCSPEGLVNDLVKRRTLLLQGGYKQIDVTAGEVRSGEALKLIEQILRGN